MDVANRSGGLRQLGRDRQDLKPKAGRATPKSAKSTIRLDEPWLPQSLAIGRIAEDKPLTGGWQLELVDIETVKLKVWQHPGSLGIATGDFQHLRIAITRQDRLRELRKLTGPGFVDKLLPP